MAHNQHKHAPPPTATAPAPAHRLSLRVTSDPANLAPVRKACEAFCAASGLDAPAANDVGLCVNEAMANVTRHAYGGRIDRPVEVAGDPLPGGGVRITIRDWGNGVNPAAVARDHLPETPGGLGLLCMRRLLDDVRYAPQPDGMLLTIEKRAGEGVRSQESGVKGQESRVKGQES